MITLRAIGILTAIALALHAGMTFYGDLVRPNFRASDLFSGEIPPDKAKLAAAGSLASFSWDGDLLANHAAAMAADVLHRPSAEAGGRASENKTAQAAVVAALKVSPIRPALWLTLGTLQAQAGEAVTPAVKMSYLTGSVPIDVAFSRVRTVTSSAAATDEEIKLLAQSDIRSALANRSRYEPLLIAAYVQATPQGKSLLLETTKVTDPRFNEILRRY
ncbi:hypothetical protein N2605_04735 [Bradyrhizobium yuanmingense]|uniref:Uncharacterized protein n=1 Tax=Bradyrhizobium yuanmingense TaxID=108015 RepID=A0ABV4GFC8_9BRAD|nr:MULTISPECIES: hypothetical protein [Bradyrhizobium]MCA1392287.1 hypothetical protein [Bradyrhizobium sp. IC3123]MCA1433507.1 hypothetical protein [Bradyrhizobium sp. BRP20]MCA1512335.1 hypothetical protein [Bradyrhizobium sp. NBAIM01]MCA1550714.1 hypothetical protein [Bradyrhizobium sp. BRP19]UWU85773.1 hypothetical protein N2605_04735 [Bradyrhizobium sp. CB1024]